MFRCQAGRRIWFAIWMCVACCQCADGQRAVGCGGERRAVKPLKAEPVKRPPPLCSFAEGAGQIPAKVPLDRVCGCTRIDGDLAIDARAVSDLSCLTGLREVTGKLTIAAATGLASIDLSGLSQLESVRGLALTGLRVDDVKVLAKLQRAEEVSLTGLTSLTTLEGLLGKLDRFQLTQADSLEDLRGLRAEIGELWLDRNAKLRTLAGFAGLTASADASPVRSVRIETNPALENLDGLFAAPPEKLQRFQVIGSPKIETLDVGGVGELSALVVRSCKALREIRGTAAIEALGQLHLTGLPALVSLPSFERLTSVVDFELIELGKIPDLAPLSSLTRIDRMSLSFLDSLTTLHGLEKVELGQRFLLEDLYSLMDLSGLRGLRSIGTFWIQDDETLTSLRGLHVHDAVELAVRYNDHLQTLDGLETLEKVGTLDVSSNPVLTSVRALRALKEAEKLFARANYKLPQCELERLAKRLPETTARELTDNGPGKCGK
jgi:hypothetical protein